jgi:hypothetical protein
MKAKPCQGTQDDDWHQDLEPQKSDPHHDPFCIKIWTADDIRNQDS